MTFRVAALLPCMWGYHEVAVRLAAGWRPFHRPHERLELLCDDGSFEAIRWRYTAIRGTTRRAGGLL